MDLKQYISDLNQQYRTGLAREHSYRPALKDLLQSLLPKMVVTNEPAHFECGAPDYIISREKDHLPVFFVEAKDVGDNDLDGHNKKGHKEQFDRYKQALDYIIFTDYLDFHLYEHGVFVDSVRIAEVKGDKIVAVSEAENKFLNMIQHLAGTAIQSITSASRLAKLMAGKARLLAKIIEQAVVADEENSNQSQANINDIFNSPQEGYRSGLREQMETFRRILLHDITPTSFADVYAQTIVYGLFAARLNDKTPEDFSRQEALSLIPKTSLFLRKLFQQLAGDPDPRIEWIIDDLVTAFGATDMQKILKGYNKDTQREDPMLHFYEDFLAAYSPALRKVRGVWYTPRPVVSFIVRAVDQLLQQEFGLAEGLADCSKVSRSVAVEQSQDKRTADRKKHVSKDLFRVQILDPAMGTGTFLAEIIRQVKAKFAGNEGIWKDYVCSYLLPRLYGFEIMMAPYTIAHMKLFLQLKDDTGLSEKEFPQLNLVLTNSLEEANKDIDTLFSYWLSQEAKRASIVKRDCPVMVMIGNPPYSGESQNKGEWIMKLMQDYKKEPGGIQALKEPNPKWLNDDYVKFIRLAQHYIERNGEGIIGFINPHGYLDNPTFRGMRWNLLKTFDKIYTIDLHGNSNKKETCPDGSKDKNVFGIKQGVSINLLVKTGKKKKEELGKVYHADLYGLRQEKYDFLDEADMESVGYTEINPQAPMYFFIPWNADVESEYQKGFSIKNLFPRSSVGIVTSNDGILIKYSDNSLLKSIEEHYNEKPNRDLIQEVSYRPFDKRLLYYDVKKIGRPRQKIMLNFINKDNIGLVTARSNKSGVECSHFYITNSLVEAKCGERTTQSSVFPLFLYKDNLGVEERVPNFNAEVVKKIEENLGEAVEPQELFDYIYAVLHSPSYRERYKEFLKIDFPRIPYPTSASQYHLLAEKGAELRRLHLMEGLPSHTGVTLPVVGTLRVDCYRWQDNRVYFNSGQYFEGVPESAWQFYIGGYQPAQKWLKDRKGMTLSFEDVKHYQRIIYVLLQTERLMTEIDTIIKEYNKYKKLSALA